MPASIFFSLVQIQDGWCSPRIGMSDEFCISVVFQMRSLLRGEILFMLDELYNESTLWLSVTTNSINIFEYQMCTSNYYATKLKTLLATPHSSVICI